MSMIIVIQCAYFLGHRKLDVVLWEIQGQTNVHPVGAWAQEEFNDKSQEAGPVQG